MSDRVLIPLGNGLLVLPQEAFEAALRAGEALFGKADGNNASNGVLPSVATTLLSAEDAGRLLAVDPSHLLRLARERRIDHVRIGKFVRFTPSTIIEQGKRLARPAASAGYAPHKNHRGESLTRGS